MEAIFIGSKKHDEDAHAYGEKAEESDEEQKGTAAVNLDNTISAAIVVAASIDDFRVSANVAQVMGNAE